MQLDDQENEGWGRETQNCSTGLLRPAIVRKNRFVHSWNIGGKPNKQWIISTKKVFKCQPCSRIYFEHVANDSENPLRLNKAHCSLRFGTSEFGLFCNIEKTLFLLRNQPLTNGHQPLRNVTVIMYASNVASIVLFLSNMFVLFAISVSKVFFVVLLRPCYCHMLCAQINMDIFFKWWLNTVLNEHAPNV